LVTHKELKDMVSKANLVHATLQGIQTDVLAIGEPLAEQTLKTRVQTLGKRIRPAEGGYSVGHFNIIAGTIVTCV
jgi:hypothetical protein